MYHLLQLSEMFHMNSICEKFLQRVSAVNLSGSGGVGRANNRKKKTVKLVMKQVLTWSYGKFSYWIEMRGETE